MLWGMLNLPDDIAATVRERIDNINVDERDGRVTVDLSGIDFSKSETVAIVAKAIAAERPDVKSFRFVGRTVRMVAKPCLPDEQNTR